MSDSLFVYGTLLPGRAPAGIADVANTLIPLGTGTIRGRLYDFGEYPGVILDDSADPIHGQLFALPPDSTVLARLDAYEDYRPDEPAKSLFLRLRVTVTLPDATTQLAWVYVYNRSVKPQSLWSEIR